jgi:AraC-like DNA-binding protein
MTKKRQDGSMWKLMQSFFHSRLNLWAIASSMTLILGIYLYYYHLPELFIFPSRNSYNFSFYTDSANGGHSKITYQTVTDSAVDMEFDLIEGFISPYVGVSIAPNTNKTLDISKYNQIHLCVKGQPVQSIGVSLFTAGPIKNKSTVNTELCFHTLLEISEEPKDYYIKLDQLKIPDWWLELNHISPDENRSPKWKKIHQLNIGSAYSPALGAGRSIKIEAISFGRDNSKLAVLLTSIGCIIILLLFIIHYFRLKRINGSTPVTIAYKAVDVENENQHLTGFLQYINTNFHNCELTLELVSDHTGINQRRIAAYIQQTFSCNFKTYVNQIRINESKRLLKHSELNMGEIAFKVGFSNQSHFNRVFKSLEGVNPSEFRLNKS